MKTTLNTSDIARAFKSDENAAWSWNGAKALAEYLEELEESTGEEMELDVTAIRCDFSEHASLEKWAESYTGKSDFWAGLEIDLFGGEGEEEKQELIRCFILDLGQLVEFDGGIIVSSF